MKAMLLLLSVLALQYCNAVTPMCIAVFLPFTSSISITAERQLKILEQCASVVYTRWGHTYEMKYLRLDTHGYPPNVGKLVYSIIGQNALKCNMSDGTQKSIDAVFGSIDDDETAIIASVLGGYKIPVISSSARSSALNNFMLYPTFTRPNPSYDQEAIVMAKLISSFHWSKIALIYLDETRAYASHFEVRPEFQLKSYPLSLLNLYQNVEDAFESIMTDQYRIIIIDAKPKIAQTVMQIASKYGMLETGDYLFFGSSRWCPEVPYASVDETGIPWDDDESKIQFNENERKQMNGLVCLSTDYVARDNMLSFIKNAIKFNPDWWPPIHNESPDPSLYPAYSSCAYAYSAYKDHLENNVSFMTAIRRVKYCDSYGTWTIFYPDGSRLVIYNITNLVNGEFISIGQWSSENIGNYGFTWQYDPHFPGNVKPDGIDTVPLKLYVLPYWVNEFVWAVIIISFLSTIVLHRLTWIQKSHEVIKASSYLFCQIIIFGSIPINLGVLINSANGFASGCVSIPISVIMGFTIIFGSLIIKTWRIHRIFNSRVLQDSKVIDNKNLLVRILLLMMFDVICILIWMVADRPLMQEVNYQLGTYINSCNCSYTSAWIGLIVGTKSIIMLFGIYLAYQIREINHNFNESRYIVIAMVIATISATLLLSIVLAFNDQPILTYLCKTCGSCIITLITLLILFVPKFWDIYVTKSWVDYQSDSSYVSGVLVHRSSRHSSVRDKFHQNSINNDEKNSVDHREEHKRPRDNNGKSHTVTDSSNHQHTDHRRAQSNTKQAISLGIPPVQTNIIAKDSPTLHGKVQLMKIPSLPIGLYVPASAHSPMSSTLVPTPKNITPKTGGLFTFNNLTVPSERKSFSQKNNVHFGANNSVQLASISPHDVNILRPSISCLGAPGSSSSECLHSDSAKADIIRFCSSIGVSSTSSVDLTHVKSVSSQVDVIPAKSDSAPAKKS